MLSLSGRLRRRVAFAIWPPAAVTIDDARATTLAAATFAADGLITAHNSDFLEDPRFQAAYRLGESTGSWFGLDVRWRAYVVCWAAMRGLGLAGDFVECGVNRGGNGRMIAEYVDLGARPDKVLHLIDTFAGIPEEFLDDRLRGLSDSLYEDCYEDVVRTFSPFANANVVRGNIPDVLQDVAPQRVCFLSIDLNCVEPSIAAAEHFWPRMSSGAVMVLDDYGWAFFADQKDAFDTFAASVGLQVLSLPTGQGLLIKP